MNNFLQLAVCRYRIEHVYVRMVRKPLYVLNLCKRISGISNSDHAESAQSSGFEKNLACVVKPMLYDPQEYRPPDCRPQSRTCEA